MHHMEASSCVKRTLQILPLNDITESENRVKKSLITVFLDTLD